eukprot:349903-Chlamydomonas_euryale.AAC.6
MCKDVHPNARCVQDACWTRSACCPPSRACQRVDAARRQGGTRGVAAWKCSGILMPVEDEEPA